MVGRDGRLTEPWIRWFQRLTGEVTTANTPAPPAPVPPPPPPAPDPGPVTEEALEGLDARVAGLEIDPSTSALAARLAKVERAIQAILQGPTP